MTNGRQPTQSTEAETPSTERGHRNRRTRCLKLTGRGASFEPATGDPLLPNRVAVPMWHTMGRSRDDFVSITPQPRAPLQSTQWARRLGCDPESSSGPPARRSRKSRPTSVNGPGPRPAKCQLERAGTATLQSIQSARSRPSDVTQSQVQAHQPGKLKSSPISVNGPGTRPAQIPT